jgi:MFS transporter, putative metabolite:H+ symporter
VATTLSSTGVLTIPSRIERLPVTRFTWKVVLLAGLAWLIESLSIGSLGVALNPLKQVMHLSAGQIGVLTAASTFGIVVGLIPAGFLADRFGRKALLVWGIVEYSLFTLLCAVAPNYLILLTFRFLSGLGMGAVFPLPYAIVSEFVRSRQRTLFNGVMDAFLSVGYFVAPLLGLWILPNLPISISWRVFFAVSALPILYAGVIKVGLPESPRWLLQRGRRDEAEAVMTQIESRVGKGLFDGSTSASEDDVRTLSLQVQTEALASKVQTEALASKVQTEALASKVQTEALASKVHMEPQGPKVQTDALASKVQTDATEAPNRALPGMSVSSPWHRPYLRLTVSRSIAAAGTFFMFYIVMTYMPMIFSSKGLSFAHSLMFTAFITAAAIPGKLLNGWLAERFGRKPMYVLFMGIAGIAALFFGLAQTPTAMMVYACVMSLFGTGAFPALKMSYAEQYPTQMRTTGAATVETIGRFAGGVIGSYTIPVMLSLYGMSVGFYVVSIVALIAVVVELLFSTETKGATLEQLEMRIGRQGG